MDGCRQENRSNTSMFIFSTLPYLSPVYAVGRGNASREEVTDITDSAQQAKTEYTRVDTMLLPSLHCHRSSKAPTMVVVEDYDDEEVRYSFFIVAIPFLRPMPRSLH